MKKSVKALKQTGLKRLVIAGGVSANLRLREQLETSLAKIKAQVYYAEPALCTDNGAMIAFAGYQRLKAGQHDGLAVTTTPRWPMTEYLFLSKIIYLQRLVGFQYLYIRYNHGLALHCQNNDQ